MRGDFGVPRWARWLVYGLGALMIVASLWYMAWAYQRVWAADDWSETPGRVEASSVRVESSTDSDGDSSTSYYPEVTYSYTVEGRAYRNDDLWLVAATGYSYPGDADAMIRAYPVGATVPVYYDPANPGDAALIYDDPPWGMLIMTAIGLVFLVGGYFLFDPRQGVFNKPMRAPPPRPPGWKPSRWPVIIFLIVFAGIWVGVIYLIFFLD